MLRRAGAPKSQAKDSQVQGHQGPGALMTRKQPDCGPLHGSFYEHNIPYLVKPLMESSWSLFHKKKQPNIILPEISLEKLIIVTQLIKNRVMKGRGFWKVVVVKVTTGEKNVKN